METAKLVYYDYLQLKKKQKILIGERLGTI